MQIISDQSQPAFPGERTVITIGAYDGLHLGHQAVISHVRQRADDMGARSAVVTFDRHPASVVRPESAPLLLTDPEQKLELLEATGVDAVVVVPFDERQAAESAEAFVERVIVGCLDARLIVVGEDFHFGRHRDGNVELLAKLGSKNDFEVEPIELLPRVDVSGEAVTSTAIRRALAQGDPAGASQMLGRDFEVRGPVLPGDQRGRLLGFPTANVQVPNSIALPADGVYAGWYVRPTGESFPCAINLGRRPTFYEEAASSLLEVHLLDFSGDLYGEEPSIRFSHFLRGERKFDGIDALKEQLQLDIAHATELLA